MPIHTTPPFRIVALGASAGGVEALTGLFKALPETVGAAFLVVLHIPATGDSHLAQVLAHVTGMPVTAARDGEPILPGRVYVASADRHLVVAQGVLRLTCGPRERRVRPAVDVLFRSAALHYGPRVIGVVLSGALDDGSAGLAAIKERQGVALVQAPSDARFGSMPESALRHVAADMVGSVAALADEIVRLTQLPAAMALPALPGGEWRTRQSLVAGAGNPPIEAGIGTVRPPVLATPVFGEAGVAEPPALGGP